MLFFGVKLSIAIIMGKKGDKSTSLGQQMAEQYLEQLSSIEGVSSKKMFGGHGIFHESKMFGIISAKGKLFFKVNEKTQIDYENAGSEKHSRMPYFSVPEEVIAGDGSLVEWALQSIEASK